MSSKKCKCKKFPIKELTKDHVGQIVQVFHRFEHNEDEPNQGHPIVYIKICDVIDQHRFIGARWDDNLHLNGRTDPNIDWWPLRGLINIYKDKYCGTWSEPVQTSHRLDLLVKTGYSISQIDEYSRYIYYNAPQSLRTLYHRLKQMIADNMRKHKDVGDLESDSFLFSQMLGHEIFLGDDTIEEKITDPTFGFRERYPEVEDYPVWKVYYLELKEKFGIEDA